MIVFSRPEPGSSFDGGDNRGIQSPAGFFFGQHPFGGLFLGRIVNKDDRAVLAADIEALAIVLGWVMQVEKGSQQLFIADRFGIEAELADFSMTTAVAADLFVTGVFHMATHIADRGIRYAVHLSKAQFHAPETARPKGGQWCHLNHLLPVWRACALDLPILSDHGREQKFASVLQLPGSSLAFSRDYVKSCPPMSSETFLWYDFETFGADPRRDRPAQFAALRTNCELEPIGDPIMSYCHPADDLLPQPMACLITGITPQLARARGVPEPEFAALVFQAMAQPGTCGVGYNSFRFDDEVARHLFWRNFFDPYQREWANGNSRFDLIDLLRLMRALRPDGVRWPDHADGRPSFRLEDLARANGIDTGQAHDALADVRTTIAMARRVRQHQPRLWDWALRLRSREQVEDLISTGQPLLHASSRFPALPACGVAPVLVLCPHPEFSSQWLVWDLNVDPRPFAALDTGELQDRLWTPKADLPEGVERLPVKLLRSNRCPTLAPMNVLDAERAAVLDIDRQQVARNAAWLREQAGMVDRLAEVFRGVGQGVTDPEYDLYGGFPPREDRPVMERLRTLLPETLAGLKSPFKDERLNTLLFRYRARNWPETLDADEHLAWQRFRRRRLLDDPDLGSVQLDDYLEQLARLSHEHPEHAAVLAQLQAWPAEIGLSGESLQSLRNTER